MACHHVPEFGMFFVKVGCVNMVKYRSLKIKVDHGVAVVHNSTNSASLCSQNIRLLLARSWLNGDTAADRFTYPLTFANVRVLAQERGGMTNTCCAASGWRGTRAQSKRSTNNPGVDSG